MSRLFSTSLNRLEPYVPGEQPDTPVTLKLNTNEHPYGPSPHALAAMQKAIGDTLRLYPDPTMRALCKVIAQHHSIAPTQVFVGNGSDEVLAHIFKALFQRPGVLLTPDISYSFYSTYSSLFEVERHPVPLAENLSLDIAPYVSFSKEVAGVLFANPNAPTGMALDLASIREILQAHPDSAVVVDEAYVDFGAESATALLAEFDNLVVVHTLSKSRALAGIRVGFAMASEAIIQALITVKDSFNSYPVDTIAQAGAMAAIADESYFQEKCKQIIQAREQLVQALNSLDFEVLPSKANFVFVRHKHLQAASISTALRERGILVRHFKQARIDNYLRITVGTSEQCDVLYQALKTIVKS